MGDRIRYARRNAHLTQVQLAKSVGTGSSAVAQWESPDGTFPTVDHLAQIASACAVAFEWLATGRGAVGLTQTETPAIDGTSLALDKSEDRLLAAYRRIPPRKRESLLRWLEEFFP